MANTSRPLAEHNLLATFADLEQARKAVQALERAGVEAGDVVLHTGQEAPASGAGARARDVAVTRHVGKWAAGGFLVGGLVFAAIVVVAINLIGVEPRMAASVGSGIAAFLLGGAIAAFWSGAKEIPVNAEALESTFGARTSGDVAVAVHTSHADRATQAEDVLRSLDPRSLRRYGAGGT
jgi:hypothetical protein